MATYASHWVQAINGTVKTIQYTVSVQGESYWDYYCLSWEQAEERRSQYLKDPNIAVVLRLLNTKIVVQDHTLCQEVFPLTADHAQMVLEWLGTSADQVVYVPIGHNALVEAKDWGLYQKRGYNIEHLYFTRHSARLNDGRRIYLAQDQFQRQIYSNAACRKQYVLAGNHDEYLEYLRKKQFTDGIDASYISCLRSILGLRDKYLSDVALVGTYEFRSDYPAILTYAERNWR